MEEKGYGKPKIRDVIVFFRCSHHTILYVNEYINSFVGEQVNLDDEYYDNSLGRWRLNRESLCPECKWKDISDTKEAKYTWKGKKVI